MNQIQEKLHMKQIKVVSIDRDGWTILYVDGKLELDTDSYNVTLKLGFEIANRYPDCEMVYVDHPDEQGIDEFLFESHEASFGTPFKTPENLKDLEDAFDRWKSEKGRADAEG